MCISDFSAVSARFLHQTLCLLLMPLFSTLAYASPTSVFINEIHYDNDGTDSNEATEIAGPSGLDLAGWRLLMYNGNGGTVYKTFDLRGTIPDLMDGFGVLSFDTPGLQNGPDGVALTDQNDQVLQFLSYEGSFTASEGAASGLTSNLIGVSEAIGTAALESLQLAGTGRFYDDFQWGGPDTETFGTLNFDQRVPQSAVPAPATLPLFLFGLAGLGFLSRDKAARRLRLR